MFNTESKQLALLKEETANLDEQIDCLYIDETFYVIKKACFEQNVGLQEEYHEKAKLIAEQMISSGVLQGWEKLKELIEKLPESEENLLQHRTDGSDAFDTLYIGCEKFLQADTTYVAVDVNRIV